MELIRQLFIWTVCVLTIIFYHDPVARIVAFFLLAHKFIHEIGK